MTARKSDFTLVLFRGRLVIAPTWLPREYWENLIYGAENTAYSEYLREFRDELRQDSIKKIKSDK